MVILQYVKLMKRNLEIFLKLNDKTRLVSKADKKKKSMLLKAYKLFSLRVED